MEINKKTNQMKPFIFTGDSFTWGEGLELYNDTIQNWLKPIFEKKQLPYTYDTVHNFSADGSPTRYRTEFRYAQIVSDYFNTFFVTDCNGGSNLSALDYAERMTDFYGSDNFSYIIMNLTSLNRDQYLIVRESLINEFEMDIGNDGKALYNFIESWYEWCSVGNFDKEFYSDVSTFNKIFNNPDRLPTFDIDSAQRIQTLFFEIDGFITYLNAIQYNFYKTKFEYFKSNGHTIKFIGHWNSYDSERFSEIPDDITEFITSNLIPIEYNNKTYNELSEMLEYSELWIDTDLPWTDNQHPSKIFHKVIGDSVIKYIENLENRK